MLHQVGVGALGPVFRTYEPTRDRLVAVKVFRLDITPEQAHALADELSVATRAGLFHPSIVEPIAAGVEGSVAYRAEEYVAAESLDVAMRHYAPASIAKVLPFISQLAAAVDFARMNGIGHGALHPRDIFVTPEEARATGFGVVEALERVSLRAPVRRPYSAPERVAGEEWGTPADVFALGAIAYELLTGRRPAGVGPAIGDLSGAPVGEHAEKVQAVLVRAMEENPASRFSTAMAFAFALEAASRGESVAAANVVLPPRPSTVRDEAKPVPPPPLVEPEIDDVTPEREEDDAFFTLAREERETARAREKAEERDLFDMEAVEDLAITSEPERFKDDFDPTVLDRPYEPDRFVSTFEPEIEPEPYREPVRPFERQPERQFDSELDRDDEVHAYVPPPRRSIDYVPEESYGAPEPRRRALPLMLMLLLGVVVGFGLGWGARSGLGSGTVAKPEATEAETDDKSAPATAPAEGARPYSEQAVTPPPQPPTQPPPIPGDAPAPSAPASGRAAAPSTGAGAPSTSPAGGTARSGATSGRIIVRSVPANAGVTVDGTWRGRTPLTLDKVRLGNHEVRVVQPGYAVARESVTLTATAPARTLSFRLESAGAAPRAPSAKPPAPTAPTRSDLPPVAPEPRGPGSLYVDSRPRGAAVFLDGKPMGVTPTTIPDVTPGPHVIRLELPDHRIWTASSTVLAGQQTRVTGSLERIR